MDTKLRLIVVVDPEAAKKLKVAEQRLPATVRMGPDPVRAAVYRPDPGLVHR